MPKVKPNYKELPKACHNMVRMMVGVQRYELARSDTVNALKLARDAHRFKGHNLTAYIVKSGRFAGVSFIRKHSLN